MYVYRRMEIIDKEEHYENNENPWTELVSSGQKCFTTV